MSDQPSRILIAVESEDGSVSTLRSSGPIRGYGCRAVPRERQPPIWPLAERVVNAGQRVADLNLSAELLADSETGQIFMLHSGLPFPEDLEPAEKMALTVALAQIERGEQPTPNIAAVCVLALARLHRAPEPAGAPS